MITKEFMQELFPKNTNALKFVDAINQACEKYKINTPQRISAFIAQIAHESGCFKYVREIWGPTKAQSGYEGRKDLGNLYAGDGKRYMGRGLIQITGRANYMQMSSALGVDFVSKPEMLEIPEYAVESAACFWSSRKLNELADSGDFKLITKRINGGLNGFDERLSIYTKAKQLLGIK